MRGGWLSLAALGMSASQPMARTPGVDYPRGTCTCGGSSKRHCKDPIHAAAKFERAAAKRARIRARNILRASGGEF